MGLQDEATKVMIAKNNGYRAKIVAATSKEAYESSDVLGGKLTDAPHLYANTDGPRSNPARATISFT